MTVRSVVLDDAVNVLARQGRSLRFVLRISGCQGTEGQVQRQHVLEIVYQRILQQNRTRFGRTAHIQVLQAMVAQMRVGAFDAGRVFLINHPCIAIGGTGTRLLGLLAYWDGFGLWRIRVLIGHAWLGQLLCRANPDWLREVFFGLRRQAFVHRLYRAQGAHYALLSLCSGMFIRRHTHAAHASSRIAIEFLPEHLNLALGLQKVSQGLAVPETDSACMSAPAHSVMGHPVHVGQALRQQGRYVADQLAIEPLRMREPKVAQCEVVYADPAAQPTISAFALAQPRQFLGLVAVALSDAGYQAPKQEVCEFVRLGLVGG